MKTEKILYLGLAGLIIGLYISVKTTFLIMLIGLLFVPPVLAIISTIYEGIKVMLKGYFNKKEYILIRTAREM